MTMDALSMRGLLRALLVAGALLTAGVIGGTLSAQAAGDANIEIAPQSWSFAGIFGYYDRGELQRGFQVYKEVCSSCHAMDYVSYRNLGEPGGPEFTEEQVKAIAAEYEVQDGPDEFGDMFSRPALPRDRFASPWRNENEARASNGGALPVDLSVITKARSYYRGTPWWFIDLFTGYQEHGADYIYALLTGYEDAPEGFELQEGMNYNAAFPGHQIAMAQPLYDDLIEYADGTPATVDQMAHDVTAFLMWTAEPHLEARKRIGFQVMIFLAIFAALLYLTKQKVWARVEH